MFEWFEFMQLNRAITEYPYYTSWAIATLVPEEMIELLCPQCWWEMMGGWVVPLSAHTCNDVF
jgi:hypothetical protein